MASSYVPFLVVFLTASIVPLSMASLPDKLHLSAASDVPAHEPEPPRPPAPDQPTVIFEVDRPHRPPPGSSGPCSTLLLSHSFANTDGKPPATAAYSPPPCLAAAGPGGSRASAISLAVLECRAACRGGAQHGRVFGVWLGGAELLRGCTADTENGGGVEWTVSKYVTKYASLLAAGDATTLAVYLGNTVDEQFTGVFHANVTLHLYFRHPSPPSPPQKQPGLGPADTVLPISRSLPLNGGLWFEILNEFYDAKASLTVPANTYRAVLEVYLSYHAGDESWYGKAGANGPFREVVVEIDGDLVGVVWPFPVVYTGGISPSLWRPVSGIGSFSFPSYDIELTPFLGKLLDVDGEKKKKHHEVRFTVTNAIDTWLVDAILHLWLDPRGTDTAAGMVSYDAPPLDTATATVPGEDGLDRTTAFRHVSAAGWVQTASYGRFTATWTQRLAFENAMRVRDGYLEPEVNQTTESYSGAHVADHVGVVYLQAAQQSFEIYKFAGVVDGRPPYFDEYTAATKVRLGFSEERVAAGRWSGFWARSLSNEQECAGEVDVEDGETVRESWGGRQTYRYEATDGCYFRNVTSHGNDVVSDHSDEACVVKGSTAAGGGGGIAEGAAAAAGLERRG